jgi:hypothetical protein
LGRERLSDLQVLCSGCHEREHEGDIQVECPQKMYQSQ